MPPNSLPAASLRFGQALFQRFQPRINPRLNPRLNDGSAGLARFRCLHRAFGAFACFLTSSRVAFQFRKSLVNAA